MPEDASFFDVKAPGGKNPYSPVLKPGEHDLIGAASDFRPVEWEEITSCATRYVENPACDSPKLPAAAVLVKSQKLVFRDSSPFRNHNQKLNWRGQTVSTALAIDMTIHVAFNNSDGGHTFHNSTRLPVHDLGEYLSPLVLLLGVHANFGRQAGVLWPILSAGLLRRRGGETGAVGLPIFWAGGGSVPLVGSIITWMTRSLTWASLS